MVETRSNDVDPIAPALKAERVQLVVVLAPVRLERPVTRGDTPKRARRVLDGWRRRTLGDFWRPRRPRRRAES